MAAFGTPEEVSGWGSSEQPGIDCLVMGHIDVENTEPGAWNTEGGAVPFACWCLWCGSGVSNEVAE